MTSLAKCAFCRKCSSKSKEDPCHINQVPRPQQTLREGSKLRKLALNSTPVYSLWRNLMHIHTFLSPTNTGVCFFKHKDSSKFLSPTFKLVTVGRTKRSLKWLRKPVSTPPPAPSLGFSSPDGEGRHSDNGTMALSSSRPAFINALQHLLGTRVKWPYCKFVFSLIF